MLNSVHLDISPIYKIIHVCLYVHKDITVKPLITHATLIAHYPITNMQTKSLIYVPLPVSDTIILMIVLLIYTPDSVLFPVLLINLLLKIHIQENVNQNVQELINMLIGLLAIVLQCVLIHGMLTHRQSHV